jgi:UDP:flavonoid glycosyltransferase YjiC (YdhE family)
MSHVEVLRCARLLVSDAGHGSVMKVLWYGVPMVLIPWGRDQPGVAARAERLGTAVVVNRERVESSALAESIGEALRASYREAAHRLSQQLRRVSSVAATCDFIERLVTEIS